MDALQIYGRGYLTFDLPYDQPNPPEMPPPGVALVAPYWSAMGLGDIGDISGIYTSQYDYQSLTGTSTLD